MARLVNWLAIATIACAVGFLGGMFGKGGASIATPLLHAVGVPAAVALAAPLPAVVPSTLAASVPYWRRRLVNRTVVAWTLGFGVPATVVGAFASRWVSGAALIRVTDVVLLGVGARLVVGHGRRAHSEGNAEASATDLPRVRLALTATAVGAISGLLANGGGFLLVPLYLAVARLPIKSALGSSLAASAVLAIPGTSVHAALGHIDWGVVAVFAAASVPLAALGARVAIAIDARRLERIYGAVIASTGAVLLAVG